MKEAELIALLRAKNEQGIQALLAEYGALMRYVAAPFLADGRDLEECVSEAAMRVWNGADRFDPARGGWTAWLTAVTRNTGPQGRPGRWGKPGGKRRFPRSLAGGGGAAR